MGRVGKKGSNFRQGIAGIWQRELGDLSPRYFSKRISASEDLVLRLGLHRKLKRHRGCVNAVSFNTEGNILVSGSDDRMVILWDWEIGKVKLEFHSSHSDNIFQARFMPFTDDRTLVTCAADGEVKQAQIREGGNVETSVLAKHEGRAHMLAIEPGSSHILYSCGEDGLVQHIDLRTKSATELFVCKSFQDKLDYMPIVHLNDIAVDPRNVNRFAIAGSDEYTRVYDIRKYDWSGSSDFGQPTDCFCPLHLIGDDDVAITGLAFSNQGELLSSYNDEYIYLFYKDQGLGPCPIHLSEESDVDSGSPSCTMDDESSPWVYKGHRNRETVKGVNFFGPNSEYVVSGSDCGRLFIWRKKDGELLRVMEGDRQVVNCIEPHPFATMMASSGIERDIKIWTPNSIEKAPPVKMEEVMMADGTDYFDVDDSDYDGVDGADWDTDAAADDDDVYFGDYMVNDDNDDGDNNDNPNDDDTSHC